MQRQKSFEDEGNRGALYLVPTPIGNLEDMTFRAVRILQEADMILAEDTRQTLKLLTHFEIDTPLTSYHEHTHSDKQEQLLASLEAGEVMAMVSDAGMPLINDPGHPLVKRCLEVGVPVIALPGANAALTALIASGMDQERFTYYGFFPRQTKMRQEILEQVGMREETAIFYESPYRVKDLLKATIQVLGANRSVVLARELTKRFEEYMRGSAEDLLLAVAEQGIKGECVVLIAGGGLEASSQLAADLSYKEHVEQLMQQEHLTSKEAIKQVAQLRSVRKQVVYQAYHELGE